MAVNLFKSHFRDEKIEAQRGKARRVKHLRRDLNLRLRFYGPRREDGPLELPVAPPNPELLHGSPERPLQLRDNIALSGAELLVQGGGRCRERPAFLIVPCAVTRGF